MNDSIVAPVSAPPIVESTPAAPTPPPVVAPLPAAPAFAEGGMPGGSGGFFKGITITDVGMIALATVTMCMIIYYYRNKIAYIKRDRSQLKQEVEELKINVQTALGPDYKTI